MERIESIRSRARRTLNPLKNFQSGERAVGLLPAEVTSQFVLTEELLGIYENSPSDPQANLVFTTRGVYAFAGAWVCLEYSEMTHVREFRGENFAEQTADTLVIQCRDGQEVKLTFSGARIGIMSGYKRRFPDLWEVLRYFLRVLAKYKS